MTRATLVVPEGLVGFRLAGDDAAGLGAARAAPTPVAADAGVIDPIGEIAASHAELVASVARLCDDAAAKLADLDRITSERLDALSAFAAELGLGLAAQVLGDEVEDGRYNPGPAVRDCLRSAIATAQGGAIHVYLNASDLALVMSTLEEAGAPEAKRSEVEFEIDPDVARGACRVDTPVGTVLHDPTSMLGDAIEKVRGALRA